jgi:hypothetical protein
MCGNAATVATEKTAGSLAEESIVLDFRIVAHDCPGRHTEVLCGVAV